MIGESVCRELQEFLAKIEPGKETADEVAKIREILSQWDEYACWGDDR